MNYDCCGTGRKEAVTELKVMVTTLHKEISMLQSQVNKYKEACRDVHSLKAEVHSLTAILETKVSHLHAHLGENIKSVILIMEHDDGAGEECQSHARSVCKTS